MILETTRVILKVKGKRLEATKTPCGITMNDVLRWNICRHTGIYIELYFYNQDFMRIDHDLVDFKKRFSESRINNDINYLQN